MKNSLTWLNQRVFKDYLELMEEDELTEENSFENRL